MLLESNLALMQRDANYLYLFTKFSFRIKKKRAFDRLIRAVF